MVIVPVLDLAGLADYNNKDQRKFVSDNPTLFLYFLQIDSRGYLMNIYQPTEEGRAVRSNYDQSNKCDMMPEDEGLEELNSDYFKVLSEEEIDNIRHKPLWGAAYDFEEDVEATCLIGDMQLDFLASLEGDPKRPSYSLPLKHHMSPYVTVIPQQGNERIDVSGIVGELKAAVFIGLLYENGAFQGDTIQEIKRNIDFLTNF